MRSKRDAKSSKRIFKYLIKVIQGALKHSVYNETESILLSVSLYISKLLCAFILFKLRT